MSIEISQISGPQWFSHKLGST